MAVRPCLACGMPTEGSRCAEHEAERLAKVYADRPGTTARGYGHRWQQLSLRAREAQPFCGEPGGCDLPVTSKNPLTVHHLVWPAITLEHVEVLCLTHNNRRGKTAR